MVLIDSVCVSEPLKRGQVTSSVPEDSWSEDGGRASVQEVTFSSWVVSVCPSAPPLSRSPFSPPLLTWPVSSGLPCQHPPTSYHGYFPHAYVVLQGTVLLYQG